MRPSEKPTILVLDAEAAAFPAFYGLLRRQGPVQVFATLDQLLADYELYPKRVILLDEMTLQRTPTALVTIIVELRGREPMALITGRDLDEFLFDLRRWGLLQVAVKNEPLQEPEIALFLECVRDGASGFGLYQYLSQTIEMYSIVLANIEDKNRGVERVINHFATANFEVHDLYDVRLILEEMLNNAFFHAFKTATGEEKYHISTFRNLAQGERIRVEYGSSATLAGFTVTDNAGTLPVKTIITKLERQMNKDGLFDISGRGLYLSRMLTTSLIINIESGRRTQIIALFDERRKLARPKPLTINYIGPDTFHEWAMEPDFD